MRFHVLGLPHTKTNRDYMPCAYTQKVYKICGMLRKLGNYVIHYGNEGSDPDCDENVPVLAEAEHHRIYGGNDWTKRQFKWDASDEGYKLFNERVPVLVKPRTGNRDILLNFFGNCLRPATDGAQVSLTVEAGIGYTGVYSRYRVFESYAWMHYIYGLLKETGGNWYDCVIPNYYNVADFPYCPTKQDYFLFIGRLNMDKGLGIAIDVCGRMNAPLWIAGQGDIGQFKTGKHCRFLGVLDANRRADVMGGARATFVASHYLEPFGGVNVESQLCGTPVITTDWGAFPETVLHGTTGYRCRTMGDFLWAAEHVQDLNPADCRTWAEANYSTDRVGLMYQEYFGKLWQLHQRGWYTVELKRGPLDWLTKTYCPTKSLPAT